MRGHRMSPKRIQRTRLKGWRMPEGAVYVGRPSEWGNPFSAMEIGKAYPQDRRWSWGRPGGPGVAG